MEDASSNAEGYRRGWVVKKWLTSGDLEKDRDALLSSPTNIHRRPSTGNCEVCAMLVLCDDCGGWRCGRVGNSRVQRRCGSCSKLTFTKTTKKREKKKEPQYGTTQQSDAQSLAMNHHGGMAAQR